MDSRTGIFLARNKRTKFNNEDMDCSYPDHNNSGEERTPAKVIDYSNVAALPKVLADYSDGKYGSVTKECDGLHDQVIQLLSVAQRLTFSPSGLASCSSPSGKHQMLTHKHKSSPISKNVIDLDFDTSVDVSDDHVLKYNEEKSSRAVIILDSDDDEGDCRIGAQDPCGPVSVANHTSAMFESHLPMFRFEAMLPAQEYPCNQLVPYEQGFARLNSDVTKGRRTPNIEFEQVILRNTTEEHRTQGLVEVRRGQKETEDLHHDLKTKSSVVKVYEVRRGQKGSGDPHHDVKAGKESIVKKSAVKRGKKESYAVKTGKESHDTKYVVRRGQFEGEDLHHDVKTGKESDVGYYEFGRGQKEGESLHQGVETEKAHVSASPVSFMGTEDMGSQNEGDIERSESDGLDDLWKDMSLAMEYSKTATSDDESVFVQNEEECNHSYLLEDDIGLVCRVCGVIQKSIETIFDYQWTKGTRTTRTYPSGSRPSKDDDDAILLSGPRTFERDLILAEIFIHPRHAKQMRPHQSDGFNFLVRNLVTDKPGGCILAHAPGSGKTFMLISFIQSFLAKYPDSRPLIILPKGILSTWKKEFQRWQVEDIPLYDFYSSNASNRSQQLEILRIWEEKRGILFLGYKQFSSIVIGGVTDKISAACQERLLKVPSLLILDEGHTPRNECTDMLNSLAKVQTPRKVVLSGTLFQNHVKEVFNILNLVRPKFLKMETSRAVVKRVLSRVHISASRRLNKGSIDSLFYESIEETLQNDDNEKRKVTIIQDLREMTKNVLHYYKGDFLDELPGLVDFTVLLKLSWKQKEMVEKLGIFEKFKKSSVGKAIYVHPHLKDIAEHAGGDKDGAFNNDNIDRAVASMNLRDGVKAKFFFTLLSMCESNGEKLLVFSQYLLPMKFLERLVTQKKGWCSGKEIFMITGDSSPEQREWSMEQFNKSPDAKVFFGSIKACGEGISLVGASRIIILDVHLNPSVTRQAIGRAFRPGQLKKVYTYRLVAADSPEEDDHRTAFRKELISKMWFEWSEYCGDHVFELGAVDVASCEDVFFENPVLGEDVQDLYSR